MDLVESLERTLKANVNILRSVSLDGSPGSKGHNGSQLETVKEFQLAVRKLEGFFLESQMLQKEIHQDDVRKQEIAMMRAELARKDQLIADQKLKLIQYQADLQELRALQAKIRSM